MQCPRCGSAGNAVAEGFAATIHRCEGCHGIGCNDDALADLRFDTLADSVRVVAAVAATLRRKMKIATKLKKAAQATA